MQYRSGTAKVRFGNFEFNPADGELRKHGTRIKLQQKPFQLLAILLEEPGRVVSREELQSRLWDDGTVVDFDKGLNTAIRKLRDALGDTAAAPRYVTTVDRRGYRFIAPVATLPEPAEAPLTTGTGSAAAVRLAPVASPEPPPRTSRRRSAIAAAAFTFAVLLGGVGVWRMSHSSKPQSSPRIMLAVLPLENLTGDPLQEYFSDGLTEEMLTRLGNIDPQHMGVIARTSVMSYKGNRTPLTRIARDLGVQYVVEGSVRRDANRVRIAVQLIQIRDQSHIWARQYDRELKDLFTVQSEIANEVADEIQLTLGDHSSARSVRASIAPRHYEAYDLYLKGQYFFNRRTLPDFERAVEYFQRAIQLEPGYARAYAGLADCYAQMAGYHLGPANELMPKARAAALKALAIDPDLPEAHTALALIVQDYEWDWQTAEKEYRRAIELNPNYATAHHWYAEHLMFVGRFDEALKESEEARKLDPLSLIIAADNAAILYFARQYDRSIEKCRSVLEMDPVLFRAHLIQSAYVEAGRYPEALADLEQERSTIPPKWYWTSLAYLNGRAHREPEARRALEQLLALNRRIPQDPELMVWAYAGLGDKEQTMTWLDKAYVEHSNVLTSLKVHPSFDFLRGDPRFETLLHKVGF